MVMAILIRKAARIIVRTWGNSDDSVCYTIMRDLDSYLISDPSSPALMGPYHL